MRLDEAGYTPSQVLGVQRDIWERISGNEGTLWLERYKRVNQGENPFAELVGQSVPPDIWKDELVSFARRKLKKVFRRGVHVDPIPASVTPEVVANLAKYNLRLVFWSDADINEKFIRPGYVKPEAWYYANVGSGNIKGEVPTRLRRGWYAADFTVGTNYTDGSQVMVSDPWSLLLERLRRELKLVGKYENTPWGSRFAITPTEWEDCVLVHMASAMSLTRAQVRLERAVEFNFIGNVYDPNRGKFAMWEWFHDRFGDAGRLDGGSRVRGGLARVSCCPRDYRSGRSVARPLVSFVQ